MVHRFRSHSMEPAQSQPELIQGLKIYQFIAANAVLYCQLGLTADEAMAVSDPKTGEAKYIIGPYPSTYDRQEALLRAYAHYLRDKTDPDPERANLSVKKAKKNPVMKSRLEMENKEATAIAQNLCLTHGWVFPSLDQESH